MTRHLALPLLLLMGSGLAPGLVRAQDPNVVDPAHYKLEFENDRVRILRVRYGPGESSVMHRHNPYVGVLLTDGRARFELPDGRVEESNWKAGAANWSEAELHRPQNTGDSPFELIAVELKDPPSSTLAEESAVREASEALVRAETARDVEAAIAFWAEDAIVQPVNAPLLIGKAAIRKFYEDFFATVPLLDFTGTTTRMDVAQSGEMAWEHGVNRFTLQGPEGPITDVGKYLAVWRRDSDGWKVVALAFSSDAAPSPPTASPER